MPSLNPKADHFVHGQTSLSLESLNAMVDIGKRVISGPGVSNFGDRIAIAGNNDLLPKPVTKVPFQVVSEEGDYLVCTAHFPDGFPVLADFPLPAQSQTVYVAKPYALQRTPFDGATVEYLEGYKETYAYSNEKPSKRTILSSDAIPYADHIDQYITPDYFEGEIIWAQYGHTNLYEPIDSEAMESITLISLNLIEVSSTFYDSVTVGSRVRLEFTSVAGPGSEASTTVYEGVEVLEKLADNQLSVAIDAEGNGLPLTPGTFTIAVETPILWQDCNEGAKIWLSNSPGYSWFKLESLEPYIGNYYLAVYKVSSTDSAGNVTWVDIPQSKYRWAFVEFPNETQPASDLRAIYYGVPSKGPVQSLSHGAYGNLFVFDVLAIVDGALGAPRKTQFVEFVSRKKSKLYPSLYEGYWYKENLDPQTGTVETIKKECYLYIKTPKYKPTLGTPYIGLLIDSKYNKIGSKYVMGVALSCCDEEADGDYSGSGNGDSCPENFCWDDETQECVCCAPECCGERCWDFMLERCYVCCDAGNYYSYTGSECLPVTTGPCPYGPVKSPIKCTIEIDDALWTAISPSYPGCARPDPVSFPMIYYTHPAWTTPPFAPDYTYSPSGGFDCWEVDPSTINAPVGIGWLRCDFACSLYNNHFSISGGSLADFVGIAEWFPFRGGLSFPCWGPGASFAFYSDFYNQTLQSYSYSPFQLVWVLGFWRVTLENYD